MVATQVSVVGCSHWDRHLFPLQGQGCTCKGSAEARSERPGYKTPDLQPAERDSVIGDRKECEGQGLAVSEITLERTFGGGQDGGDAENPAQSWRSTSKAWRSCYTIVRIDRCQSRRVTGNGLLDVPHSWSVLAQRGKPKCLVASTPSRNQSPLSILNIRFILTFSTRPFSDHYVSRKLLSLRTGSKYFARALLRWRRFWNGPQVTTRKQDFVRDCRCMQVVSVQTGC